jgi:spore maturation protein CgeB
MNIVIVGLSLSSSWGNGHATTYRSLIPGLRRLGHRVHFLERDVPWYAANRDLLRPPYCELSYYDGPADLLQKYGAELAAADAVIVGSYVPDGIEVIDLLLAARPTGVCFYDIDTPVTLARLRRSEEEYVARRQIPHFAAYFSFSGGQSLERLRDEFGARRALPLYCSVDPDRYAPTGERPHWDLGYLGTYSADRQPALDRLLLEPARRLPHLRFVVAGPQYPADIVWPANVERIEHLPPEQHASFYSRQRFTLNVTRADMIAAGWSPSVRLFEAASCRTAILSDAWPGLDSILPVGRAIRVVATADDVVAVLTTMSEVERESMAALGQQIVHRRHTGIERASELATALEQVAAEQDHHEQGVSTP